MCISKQEYVYYLLLWTHTSHMRTFSVLDGTYHASVGSATLIFMLQNYCLYKFFFGQYHEHMILSF